jgi:putative ABC transport system permease protein
MRARIEDFARDLRYALRMLRRTRGFTVTAIAVLAVGIGANTAVFSVVNAVMIRSLPYPEADRILQLVTQSPVGISTLASIPRFNVWREGTRVFEALAAYQVSDPGVSLTGADIPDHLRAMHVSREYFAVFGACLAYGRTFTSDEDRPHGPHAAILSHGLWVRRFGRDPSIVGRTIALGGSFHEVIGITHSGFSSDPPADIFLPLQADHFSMDQANTVRVAGRLAPQATIRAARFQVGATTPIFRRKFPLVLAPLEGFSVVPLRDIVVGDVKPALGLTSGAVIFVLLIACANVANLLLARGHKRRREIATRTALGARRTRIVAQLLTESALLALAGGVLGLFAGHAGVCALLSISSWNVPRVGAEGSAVTRDPNVLVFALSLALVTGCVFGVIPALHSSRVDLSAAFKDSGAASEPGWRRNRAQSALVVGEVMLALVLLVGAGLLIKTVMALRTMDRGFDPRNVLTLDVSLSGTSFDTADGIDALVRNARQRLETIAAVSDIAVSRALPVESSFGMTVAVDGAPTSIVASWRSVSPRYFDLYRIRLLRGRTFTDHDTTNTLPVVIINNAMARKFWNRMNPIGGRLTIGSEAGPAFRDPMRHVVGVVDDVQDTDANRSDEPTVYLPLAQVSDPITSRNNRLFPLTWSVRTSIDPRPLIGSVERELRSATGGLPPARVRTMEEIIAASTERAALLMALLTTFAGIALMLAIIGLYGLMSFSVQQRTHEIGIRIALGAVPGQVQTLVLLEGLRLALAGVASGMVAALMLTRLMVNLIFGVKTWDPVVFISVAALLSLIALIAAYVQAVRATRIAPLEALRR